MRFYSSYMISVYSTNISLAIITARLYYIHYILYIYCTLYCTLYCFVKFLCFITTYVNAILCSQLNKRMNKQLYNTRHPLVKSGSLTLFSLIGNNTNISFGAEGLFPL